MDTDDRDMEPDMEQSVTEPDEETLAEEPTEAGGEETSEQAGEEAEGEGPKVAPSVKPSFFARAAAAVSAPFQRIRLPAWNLRLFGWGLLALIIIAFFVMNWAPMRLYFFGLSIDIPRALAIVILIGAGFVAGWLVRTPSTASDDEEGE